MKKFLLLLAVLAGGLSLLLTVGLLRLEHDGRLLVFFGWVLALVLAALGFYAFVSALRYSGDALSISSEERRLQIEMRALLAQRRTQPTDDTES